MKNTFYYIFTIAFVFILILKSQAQDWIITESDNSITYVADGWIKTFGSDEEEDISIFNSSKDIIIMISESNETYAKGSGSDFCNAMKSMRDEMYNNLPPEQVKMMKDMIDNQKTQPIPQVTVSKESGEEISGYPTVKYSILVDGELYEEKWITSDPALKSLSVTYKNMQVLGSKMASCSVPDESFLKTSPEFTPEYQKVELAGVEVKSVSYEYGSPEENTHVVSFEKGDISASEFDVPDGYSEISFGDFIMSMSDM